MYFCEDDKDSIDHIFSQFSWQILKSKLNTKCNITFQVRITQNLVLFGLDSDKDGRGVWIHHSPWWSWCLTSTETIRLIRDGEKGAWRWGEREIIYLSLHCHHQNDSCIKMGSDESHFNVSVGSDGQSHKTVSTNHNLFDEKGEPKRYRTEVLPLTSLTPYR